VKVFPNPSTTNFNVQVITAGNEEISVRILDIQGRFIKSAKVAPNKTMNIGSDLKAGAYFIEVRQGKEVKTTRVMKF
jgi:flagellar biosynthesis component FlhA